MKKVFLHTVTGLAVVMEDEPESGWIVAHVPALPGCISQGCGLSEAAQNISSAIEDYLAIIQEAEPARFEALTRTTSGSGAVDAQSTNGQAA